MTDEIPQEVREAVRRILGGYSERQDERWRGLATWEQHDAKAVQILAAVVPRIEQRVIDKLAREAAGGPVPDDHPGVLASLGPLCTLTMDTSERERVKMAQIVIHAARPYLVACGVAAERARLLSEATSPDALKRAANAICHQWRKGESYEDRARAAIAAALAPERTGEGNDA